MIEKIVNTHRVSLHAKITFYLLVMHALLLPFSQLQQTRFTGIATILLCINWLLEGQVRHKLTRIAQMPAFWCFTGLYVLMLVGMVYTSNQADGLQKLTVRLPLLLFPLIIFSSQTLDRRQLDYIYQGFIISVGLASLYTFRLGLDFLQYEHGLISDTDNLLVLQRPYFGLYLGLTFYLAVQYFVRATTVTSKVLWIAAAVYFLGFLLLLQVKMPILALLFTLPLAGFLYLLFQKKYTFTVLYTILLFAALALFFTIHDESRQLVQTIWQGKLLAQGVQGYDWRHSLDSRTQIWQFCFDILKEDRVLYIGLGTGDLSDKLKEVYCANGDFWCQMQFNPHNQLIEETLRLGLPGLLLLLLMFIYPLTISIRKKRLTYSLFNGFMFLCLMTESYLNREAGVLFFALFNTLMFYSFNFQDKSQELNTNLRTQLAK